MELFVHQYDTGCAAGAVCAVLEDSIMRKGSPVAAGSRMLEGFISPIDATVVSRLESVGISILGKTRMDEFGAAGLFAALPNPHDPQAGLSEPTQILGSQLEKRSGAVAAVADGIADFALCNDYTGSVGVEAAARGLYYLHPTYGSVSRYGLIPLTPSMDQIGVVCKTPEDGLRFLATIAGFDEKDGAMRPAQGVERGTRSAECETWGVGAGDDAALTVGLPSNALGCFPGSADFNKFIGKFNTIEFELKHFDVYAQVMQILCCAELSNCISRYDGVKFGHRASGYNGLRELYTRSRTEAFGADAKLSALTGAMVLSQEYYSKYYDKAMRIRRLIKESLDFDKYDVIAMPSGAALALQALPRLCGLPALTIPAHGGGITLIADANREAFLFRIASGL